MYDYVAVFSPSQTNGWRSKDGWDGQGQGGWGPFDQVGDEIKGDLYIHYLLQREMISTTCTDASSVESTSAVFG